MTSHELARLLLARRDNDIRFLVIVDDDPDGDAPYREQLMEPYAPERMSVLFGEETVLYDSDQDCVIIRTGVLVVGESAG